MSLQDGRTAVAGAAGEIQLRSASLMTGYLPDEETAQTFSDGWYRTGDVGYIERDGWVHITDRSKEMIKVRGFQVAPAEVEGVLLGHPAVEDSAVFGVPDAANGESIIAAVLRGGAGRDRRLTRWSGSGWRPTSGRRVVFVDPNPAPAFGKGVAPGAQGALWTCVYG